MGYTKLTEQCLGVSWHSVTVKCPSYRSGVRTLKPFELHLSRGNSRSLQRAGAKSQRKEAVGFSGTLKKLRGKNGALLKIFMTLCGIFYPPHITYKAVQHQMSWGSGGSV